MITITDLWACQRRFVKYSGSYPSGIPERLQSLGIYLKDKKIAHFFGGIYPKDKLNITFDIDKKLNPSYIVDLTREKVPFDKETFSIVICDPPYDVDKNIYAKGIYGKEIVKPYSFVPEAVRICKKDGYICILHQLVYKRPKGTERFAVIGITTGANQRIRVLNIFKKK